MRSLTQYVTYYYLTENERTEWCFSFITSKIACKQALRELLVRSENKQRGSSESRSYEIASHMALVY